MKTIKKLIIWGLAIIVVVVVLGAVGIAIFLPKEKVKELALHKISTALNREVTIDDISVSIWGGLGVRLENIKISNPDGFRWSQFLEAKGLDIKLQIWPLLRKKIMVDRLIFIEPKIALLKTRDGQINYIFGVIDSLTPPPIKDKLPEESGLAVAAISFDNFVIEDGNIEYVDDSSETGVSVFGLNLKSKLQNPEDMVYLVEGNFQADSVKTSQADLKLPALKIASSYKAKVDLQKKQALLSDTWVEVNGLKFDIKAGIPNTETFDFVNADIKSEKQRLSDILTILPPEYKAMIKDYKISGDIELTASIKYNGTVKNSMRVTGTANIDNLKLATSDLPGEIDVKKTGIDFSNDHVGVVLQGGTYDGNPLDGSIKVANFDDMTIDGRFKGKIDLAILNRFLPEAGSPQIKGSTVFDLSAAGRIKELSTLKLSGSLAVQNGSYTAETLPEPFESFALDIKMKPREMTVTNFSVKTPSSDFSMTGTLTDPFPYLLPGYTGDASRPQLSFKLQSHRFNTDKLFPEAVPGAGPNLSELPPDSLPPILLPDIDGRGTATIDTLIYSQVEFTRITGDIAIKDRRIYITNADGNAYTGKVNGEMTVDLNDFENPKYDGKFQANQIEANDFLTRFTHFGGHLFGKVNMTGGFSASGWDPEPIMNSLNMTGDADLKEAKLVNIDLIKKLADQMKFKTFDEETVRNMKSAFKVKDGRVAFDEFKFISNLGDWAIGGSAGFDGSLNYKGNILLSETNTQSLLSQAGLVSSLAGLLQEKSSKRVRLPFTIGGTYSNPKISLDLSANDAIKENVGDALKGLFKK